MKKQSSRISSLAAVALALSFTGLASPVYAHGDAAHNKPKTAAPISTEEKVFGKQGDPKKVTRTIVIDMDDTMHFGMSEIKVKQGETIKFVAKNNGKLMHEMVLGTMTELKEHGELMKKHPGMEHDEPYMAHVGPGKEAEMIWQFTKAGEFNYACLVPGHLEAGMLGKITVAKK